MLYALKRGLEKFQYSEGMLKCLDIWMHALAKAVPMNTQSDDMVYTVCNVYGCVSERGMHVF